MQNNSNRCPFCAEKDLRIDGTCTHTPTGSPSTPTPDTATEFERQCQADFDEYRKAYPECHGYDFGHAWRAGRKWTLANDPLVRQMAACLASINVQQIVNGKVGQELRATEISEILEAYRQACEGE